MTAMTLVVEMIDPAFSSEDAVGVFVAEYS
jgi:hypothetical protein